MIPTPSSCVLVIFIQEAEARASWPKQKISNERLIDPRRFQEINQGHFNHYIMYRHLIFDIWECILNIVRLDDTAANDK